MIPFDQAMIGSRVTWKRKEHDEERQGRLVGAFVSGEHYLNFIVRESLAESWSMQQVIIICVTTYHEVRIFASAT